VLQCVAVCCSMLQCVSVRTHCSKNHSKCSDISHHFITQCIAVLAHASYPSTPPQLVCSVLQCVAVCCSVLQRVAVCCSVLQRIAPYCSVLQCNALCCVAVCCRVLQCVTEHPIILSITRLMPHCPPPIVAVCCSVWQHVAVCCRVVQCIIAYCSV